METDFSYNFDHRDLVKLAHDLGMVVKSKGNPRIYQGNLGLVKYY